MTSAVSVVRIVLGDDLVILTGVRGNLKVVLIVTFLIPNSDDHFLSYFLALLLKTFCLDLYSIFLNGSFVSHTFSLVLFIF